MYSHVRLLIQQKELGSRALFCAPQRAGLDFRRQELLDLALPLIKP